MRPENTQLSEALAEALRTACANLDNVAIPGFGTFATEKTDEYVATDPQTGSRMLMPPHISVKFHPGSQLRKQLPAHE